MFPFENSSSFYNMSNLNNNINNNIINNNDVYFNVFNNSNKIYNINHQNEQNLISNAHKKKKRKKVKKKLINKIKEKRPYDWVCNRCKNLNYSFRTICNICKLPLKDNHLFESSK